MQVSVVICVHSQERYDDFCAAVESVLDQTYDNIEVVVVVDGNDAVYDRVTNEYGDDERVILHCNSENVGLLRSRNTGAKLADGDVVAFMDDDAVADERWVEELVRIYEREDAESVGGKMTPLWVAGKPAFLPEAFYWLVGVTHRGFGEEGQVRNTFGSNISFRRDVFLELDGFDPDIGGRKGDRNLQGGETELAARLRTELGGAVYYNPGAMVGHKVFDYRTAPGWLLRRAFWQGYSKRAMEVLVDDPGEEETAFLGKILFQFAPERLWNAVTGPSLAEAQKFVMLAVLTACVGVGYLYGLTQWR